MQVIESKERMVESTADVLVIAVDCAGGAAGSPSWGAARKLRRRFPAVFKAYASACERGEVTPGSVSVHEVAREDGAGPRFVALVAVKERTRDRSGIDHVEAGLVRVRDLVVGERVSSVAMAPLGYEPDLAAWDDAWPVLRALVEEVFAGVPGELRIAVHAPAISKRWPRGCPSVTQLRTGRMISGLGVRELAAAAGLSPTSITKLENRTSAIPRRVTLEALRQALESEGIEFGSNGWVRLAADHGLVIDEAASMSRDACVRALEAIEKARWILRKACAVSRDGVGEE